MSKTGLPPITSLSCFYQDSFGRSSLYKIHIYCFKVNFLHFKSKRNTHTHPWNIYIPTIIYIQTIIAVIFVGYSWDTSMPGFRASLIALRCSQQSGTLHPSHPAGCFCGCLLFKRCFSWGVKMRGFKSVRRWGRFAVSVLGKLRDEFWHRGQCSRRAFATTRGFGTKKRVWWSQLGGWIDFGCALYIEKRL